MSIPPAGLKSAGIVVLSNAVAKLERARGGAARAPESKERAKTSDKSISNENHAGFSTVK